MDKSTRNFLGRACDVLRFMSTPHEWAAVSNGMLLADVTSDPTALIGLARKFLRDGHGTTVALFCREIQEEARAHGYWTHVADLGPGQKPEITPASGQQMTDLPLVFPEGD